MDIDLSAMVTQYSVAKHGDMYLAPNFKVKEFACKDGSDAVFINVLIPLVCQIVRNQTGKGFTPNSAYRTVTHTKPVKGPQNRTTFMAMPLIFLPLGGQCSRYIISWISW